MNTCCSGTPRKLCRSVDSSNQRAWMDDNFHVPSEVMFREILPRVPLKSLLRFKSVNKSWNLVISDDYDFMKSHLDHNKNNRNCFMATTFNSCVKFNYCDPDGMRKQDTSFVGSVNGLVCLYNLRPKRYRQENLDPITQIGIWNPAIRQCKQISPPPQCPFFAFGFGYDSISNDYKVIYLRTLEGQPLSADVYSCQVDSWSKTNIILPDFVFQGTLCVGKQCTIVNGNPYWLYTESQVKAIIIWFDVENNVLRLLSGAELPVYPYCSYATMLVDFMNSLAAIIYIDQKVDVYHYYERDGFWCKTYTIQEPKPEIGIKSGLRYFWDGDILFYDMDENLWPKNLETIQVRSLRCISYINNAFPHMESLIYLKGMKPLNFKESEFGVRLITK